MIESDRVSSIWFTRDSGDVSTMNPRSPGHRGLRSSHPGLPQVESPLSRQVIRQGRPGCGRVLLFPGMHGSIAAFHRLAGIMPESMEVVGWDHLGLDEGLTFLGIWRTSWRHRRGRDHERPRLRGADSGLRLLRGGQHRSGGSPPPRSAGGRLIVLDGHPAESIARIPDGGGASPSPGRGGTR